jgi:hypothetical protein
VITNTLTTAATRDVFLCVLFISLSFHQFLESK